MSKLRHWKERYDPERDLFFLKRLRMGDGYVFPGDPVTEEMREKLGPHRLKTWWKGGTIAHEVPAGAMHRVAEQKEGTYPKVLKSNTSWFTVEVSEGDVRKVNGRKALDELLESLKN